MPGMCMWPMLRRSTLSCLVRDHLRWNGGASLFMCQRSTRKPSASRSIVDRLGLVGVLLRAAERLGVDEGEVGEVAQVVDDQQLVGVVVHVVRHALPLRIVADRE